MWYKYGILQCILHMDSKQQLLHNLRVNGKMIRKTRNYYQLNDIERIPVKIVGLYLKHGLKKSIVYFYTILIE